MPGPNPEPPPDGMPDATSYLEEKLGIPGDSLADQAMNEEPQNTSQDTPPSEEEGPGPFGDEHGQLADKWAHRCLEAVQRCDEEVRSDDLCSCGKTIRMYLLRALDKEVDAND